MKNNKTTHNKLLKYLLGSIILATLTACGGGSDKKSDSGCLTVLPDRDHDGFPDSGDDDTPFENGKYANLENVVNSEGVKRILKIAKEKGVDVKLQLGNNPPKLNGIFKSETGGYIYYARNSPVRTMGSPIIEGESKYCTRKGHSRALRNSPKPFGYGSLFGVLRGEGKYYSIYSLGAHPYSNECTNYHVYVENGKVAKNGDIVHLKYIIAPLGYEETRAGACDVYKGSKRWEEVFTTADQKKITDVDDLEYMCVDEGKAYVPYETWKNKDKESCKCTTDVEIECE